MAIDPTNTPPTGFTSVEQVEKAISDHRDKQGTMLHDTFIDELDTLYRAKASMLRSKPADQQPDSLRAFEPALPEQQAQQQPGNQPTPMTEQDATLRSELVNDWGSQYESRVESVGELAKQVFETPERFNSFAATLPEDAKRSVLYQLSEALELMCQTDEEAANYGAIVDQKLEALWGENLAVNAAAARRGLVKIFGSLDRYTQLTESRALSPDAHVKIAIAAAEIGRLTK